MSDDELLKRLDVSHLETFEQDDVEHVCMDSILETYHWAAARIRELEAELERQRDLGADIAMGRKVIVPVEPTEAMMDAIEECCLDDVRPSPRRGIPSDVARLYRAMIRAAQEKADEATD